MRKTILENLKSLEDDYNIRILYACESGSRAWGFESADSDFDVRFVYVHIKDWYLAIFDGRDVLELPINNDLDINGWDLKKSLQLFYKCNMSLMEWLHSPIIYSENSQFVADIKKLMAQYFCPKRAVFHYLNMAKKSYGNFLIKDPVSYKKLFYTLRPVLACKWIEVNKSMPPVSFSELLIREFVTADLNEMIGNILCEKRETHELDKLSIDPSLIAYCKDGIDYCESFAISMDSNRTQSTTNLDLLFQKYLFY